MITDGDLDAAYVQDTIIAIKCAQCTKKLDDCECLTECDPCEGTGQIDCFEDMWSHSQEEHYTVDWEEECGECDGTGKIPLHGGKS